MNILLAVAFVLHLGLTSYRAPIPKKVLVIQQNIYNEKKNSKDSIFVHYKDGEGGAQLNNRIAQNCGADTSFICTMFVANPGSVIQDISFTRFPRLKHLILAGNDESYLDSIHYNFFDNHSLKKITLSSIYMKAGLEGRKGRQQVKDFIRNARKDIKVRFKPMGAYNEIGWN